ncbi:MAG: aminodeoxychorismate/anthranilate synthase component II [Planctomycetia bacterium]|nr:aminodeoxychorismate/anthranilate synthase component II [Planctomycetia bacterium]RLT12755.1 MAG: aminodeoxychorismate/anthranilate synthase component II [Planctomycetota bacterium]
MIVVLDNRDSFVFNLTRYFHLLGVPAVVLPSHNVDVAEIKRLAPQALVISPGPCTPHEAGCSVACVQAFRGRVPVLGVCLGHQVIAAALGAQIIRAHEPVHGRTSRVLHDGSRLFATIPNPMIACRYHSLIVDSKALPVGLTVTATDETGTIMALEQAADKLYGVQFHPESILTQHGFQLLANFLDLAGVPRHDELPHMNDCNGIEDAIADDSRIVTF